MPIYKDKVKKDGLNRYRVKINYKDATGKNCQLMRTTYGLAEAKQLESDLISEYVKNASVVNKMTVGECHTEYIRNLQEKRRITSLTKKDSWYRVGIEPYLNDSEISKLTVKDIEDWKTKLSSKGYAISTLRNFYSELNATLNFAVRMDFATKNILRSCENFEVVDRQFSKHKKIQYYTAEEFSLFIAEARACADRIGTVKEYGYYVFFVLLFTLGCRKGEANSLKWSDLHDNYIDIHRSISQKIKGYTDIETYPKNESSYRTIQVPVSVLTILQEHKERQKQMNGFSEDWRICGGIETLRDNTISNRNVQYAEAVGLHHIRIHDFRHSHASLLANAGINIQEISRRLGHSDVRETWNTYAHLYPKEEERAVALIEQVKM